MDRTERRLLLRGKLPYLGLTRSSSRDRKQSCECYCGIHQVTALEITPPLERMVRVPPVSTCHQCPPRACVERQLYNSRN
jgi:hypothetical protein